MSSYNLHVQHAIKRSVSNLNNYGESCIPSQMHAAYVFNEGKYINVKQADYCIPNESSKLSDFDQHAVVFWRKCDLHERANNTTYSEYEIDFPRELNFEQLTTLMRKFVKKEY